MSQEIEIEFKNLLSKTSFARLLTSLPFPKNGKVQVNYYFETADFSLKKHHSALRIRKKDDQYTLTLKEPHEEGLLETHDKLTETEATEWIHGKVIPKTHTTKQLLNMNIDPLALIYYGNLTTKRYQYIDNDIIFVLDHNMYNGLQDYELEIEAPHREKGIKAFEQLLERFNIPKTETPHKIERFFHTRK